LGGWPPTPTPQTPIPNPQSPINYYIYVSNIFNKLFYKL